MPTQAAKVFEVERRDVFMLRDILPGPAWSPYSSGIPARSREVEPIFEEESGEEEGSNLRGLVIALALEAILAVSVYELWRGWHFLR
ncbi:MAG: hypothetical protein ABSF17_19510 [Terracidiphilus sp.]